MALVIPVALQAFVIPSTSERAPIVSSSLPLRRSSSTPNSDRAHSMGPSVRRVSTLGRSMTTSACNMSAPLGSLQKDGMQCGDLVLELLNLANEHGVVRRHRPRGGLAGQSVEAAFQFARAVLFRGAEVGKRFGGENDVGVRLLCGQARLFEFGIAPHPDVLSPPENPAEEPNRH